MTLFISFKHSHFDTFVFHFYFIRTEIPAIALTFLGIPFNRRILLPCSSSTLSFPLGVYSNVLNSLFCWILRHARMDPCLLSIAYFLWWEKLARCINQGGSSYFHQGCLPLALPIQCQRLQYSGANRSVGGIYFPLTAHIWDASPIFYLKTRPVGVIGSTDIKK